MTGFDLQPVESVEMTHLAPTFFDRGENHPNLNTHYPLYKMFPGQVRHLNTINNLPPETRHSRVILASFDPPRAGA